MFSDSPAGLELQMLRFIWNLQKKKSILIVLAIVIGAASEALGLAMVPLLLSFMMGSSSRVLDGIGFIKSFDLDRNATSIYLVAGFFTVFIFKTIILSYINWVQSKYIYNAKKIFSQKIYFIYINESYERSLETESSTKVSNITVEMHAFIVNFLYPAMLLITELFVVAAMIIVAVIIEPMAAVTAVAVIIISLFAIDFFTRRRLKRWGADRVAGEAAKVQSAQQALDIFKEIKIGNTTNFFNRIFNKKLEYLQSVETNELALSQMPRLWLEAVAVLALAVVMTVSASTSGNAEQSIATAGLFALLAFRLMPSANRIIVSIQKIRYSYSTLETLLKIINSYNMDQTHSHKHSAIQRDWKAINLNKVGYKYKNEIYNSIEGISFTVLRGECIGIVGPSGVGKSTLLDVMLSLLPPSQGKIDIDGVPLSSVAEAWRFSCGYVPQSPLLISGTLASNVAFGIDQESIDIQKVNIALEQAGLSEFIDNSEMLIGERGSTLSGGQRQRISIARTLYRDPDILFFDEATSALDKASGMKLVDTIEKLKGTKTIILVTHQEYPLKVCDKIFRLSKDGSLRVEDKRVEDRK